MADWPETLPQALLIEGYSEAPANTLVRTSMESGPAKVRRRATAAIRPVKGTLVLTAAELAYLKNFYNTTLLGGALRFNWVDPLTEAAVEMRFTETPTWIAQDGLYKVSLGLEILP